MWIFQKIFLRNFHFCVFLSGLNQEICLINRIRELVYSCFWPVVIQLNLRPIILVLLHCPPAPKFCLLNSLISICIFYLSHWNDLPILIVHIFQFMSYYYSPQTKLQEGNVFTGVCHSVHRGVGSYPSGPNPPRDHTPPPRTITPRTTKWVVRILLECFLVTIASAQLYQKQTSARIIWHISSTTCNFQIFWAVNEHSNFIHVVTYACSLPQGWFPASYYFYLFLSWQLLRKLVVWAEYTTPSFIDSLLTKYVVSWNYPTSRGFFSEKMIKTSKLQNVIRFLFKRESSFTKDNEKFK